MKELIEAVQRMQDYWRAFEYSFEVWMVTAYYVGIKF